MCLRSHLVSLGATVSALSSFSDNSDVLPVDQLGACFDAHRVIRLMCLGKGRSV